MKTVSPNTQTKGQEFLQFLGSIDLKDCFELTHLFPNDPDTWNETKKLTYNWNEYVVELWVNAEFELEEKYDDVDQTMVWIEVDSVEISKNGEYILEDEIFGIHYDRLREAVKNPYESKPEEKLFSADIRLDLVAKSESQAKIIIRKAIELINKAEDITWAEQRELWSTGKELKTA